MPSIDINGHVAHYRFDGAPDAPLLVLSHSLGVSLEMWDAQAAAFSARFRVLRYDTRGHGGSQLTPGPYSVELLGRDVLALVDAVAGGGSGFSYCGLSLGGLIGQWLGAHAGPRLRRLVLCNTAPRIGTHDGWNARIATVMRDGMGQTAAATIDRWFTAGFIQQHPQRVEPIRRALLATDPAAYAACCAAVRDADFRANAIRAPLLVVTGRHDAGTTVADGHAVATQAADARVVELDSSHLSNIEAQAAFDAAVLGFLD